jgi:hypothetical protein
MFLGSGRSYKILEERPREVLALQLTEKTIEKSKSRTPARNSTISTPNRPSPLRSPSTSFFDPQLRAAYGNTPSSGRNIKSPHIRKGTKRSVAASPHPEKIQKRNPVPLTPDRDITSSTENNPKVKSITDDLLQL